MQMMRPMVFRSNPPLFFVFLVIAGLSFDGCISYQIVKSVNGYAVSLPEDLLRENQTTLTEALGILGAPNQVAEINGMDLLLYQRSVFYRHRIAIGIPLSDPTGPSFDISAYGSLERYDILALFFTPEGMLNYFVYEKGSDNSYLKTLFNKH